MTSLSCSHWFPLPSYPKKPPFMEENADFILVKVKVNQQLLKEAKDIQQEIDRFLLKSNEVHGKMQSAIDSFSIITQKFWNMWPYVAFSNALYVLKARLEESKYFIKEMGNLYKDPSLIHNNPRITPQNLKALIDGLKAINFDVKWNSLSLVSDLGHIRLIKTTMAQGLSEYVGSPVQSLPTKPFTAPTPATQRSELLIKMNDMLVKLSPKTFESPSFDLPTPKPVPGDQQKPGFPSESKPTPSSTQSTQGNEGFKAQNEKTNAGHESKVSPKNVHVSAPNPSTSLKKALLEMETMVKKLLPESLKPLDTPADSGPSFAEEVTPPTAKPNASQSAQNQFAAQGNAGMKAKHGELKVDQQLVKKANDIQNDIYLLKKLSKEKEAKLQKAIDSVNSKIDFCSVDKEKVFKELAIKYFEHTLLELKSKLASAKADIAILRKKFQDPLFKMSIGQVKSDPTSHMLQKPLHEVLWFKSFVRSHLNHEKLLIETMAQALSESNVNGVLIFSTTQPSQTLNEANIKPTSGIANIERLAYFFKSIREYHENNASKQEQEASKTSPVAEANSVFDKKGSQVPTPAQESEASEYDQPMQTPKTPTQDPEAQTNKLAEEKIEAGQQFYKLAKYKEAVQMFSEACKLCPESSVYISKKADALMMLGEHKSALQEAQVAVAIDPTTCKAGYIVIAKCCFKLGDIESSEDAVRRAIDLFGESSVSSENEMLKELRSRQEQVREQMEKENYPHALLLSTWCLQFCPSFYEVQLMRSECLANERQCREAEEIAHRIMPHLNPRLLFGAYYVLGLCAYHQDKNEEAIKWFQKINKACRYQKKIAMSLDVAKRRVVLQKKGKGTEAFETGKFQEALDLYIEALDVNIDDKVMNATLHYNKATTYAKLNRTREAEQACTVALDLKPDYIKALERRAQCCRELGEHEDAVEDYKRLVELYKRANLLDTNVRQLLREAEKVLEKFKSVNYYYKILGLKPHDLNKTIKKSYQAKALYYHPDKHAGAGQAVFARESRRAQRVIDAYAVLGDPGKRANYDLQQSRCHYTSDNESSDEDAETASSSNGHFPRLIPIRKLKPFTYYRHF